MHSKLDFEFKVRLLQDDRSAALTLSMARATPVEPCLAGRGVSVLVCSGEQHGRASRCPEVAWTDSNPQSGCTACQVRLHPANPATSVCHGST